MGIDYRAVLADLEGKKAAIEASIASLKAMLGLGSVATQSETAPMSHDEQPTELPVGAFLGQSIPTAIKMYLQAVRQKKTTREIAAALREYGIESTTDNFEGVVAAALHRMKSNKVLLRFKDGWGLAELYPEGLRKKLAQGAKAQTAKVANKKAKGKKKKTKTASRQPKPSKPAAPGLEHRIEQLLKAAPGKEFVAKDVAESLGVDARAIALAFGRMTKNGKIEKAGGGAYRALGTNLREMPKAV